MKIHLNTYLYYVCTKIIGRRIPLEKRAADLLKLAVNRGVSDIHILPDQTSYKIHFRVSTGMQKVSEYPLELGERLISYFKFLSNMDVGERRKPQSGSCSYSVDKTTIELRLSTISNYLYQESLVLRILYSQKNELNENMQVFFKKDSLQLEKLLNYKSGLILFSGPVGSGKTTTIYHLLRKKYATEPIQVITMEDPVEIKEPNFLQTQINEKAGISYSALIKQSLRHHPDILVIGEIRDEETAKMVIRSALTGHLVLATIHAKECLGVLERMLELDVSYEQLKQSLIGIVSQRLINKYCAICEGPCSVFCEHFPVHQKRAVLFEIISGDSLKKVMDKKGGNPQFKRMNQKLRTAYVCGFITKKDFQEYQLF